MVECSLAVAMERVEGEVEVEKVTGHAGGYGK
jgi:hypothetical protein